MIDLESFERFSGVRIRGKGDEISISKSGSISFGKAASVLYKALEFDYAILFFNRKTNEIALKLTNTKEQNAFNIRKGNDTAQISAGSFFKYYNITIGQNVKVSPEYEEIENVLAWKMPEDQKE